MYIRLRDSFGAVYASLERPRIARRAVAVILVIHTLLLGYSAYVHSPTLNEPGHLVAGLSYWRFGQFDLYRVNPPLAKLVAALPVMAAGYKLDWIEAYKEKSARPENRMGSRFVEANGERSYFLFMISRWACIPFSWIGAIVCYLWARDLYGRPSGVLACAIWCFEPNILAHSSLVTQDAHAAAMGLAACYTFWRWLRKPTWGQAALTGLVLGLAELIKTTLILFYPLWPMMWLVYRLTEKRSMTRNDWLREAGMLTLRMAIGLYVLNLGYGFEGSFTKLNQFHFTSDLFAGPIKAVTNGFAYTDFGNVPVPLPKNYVRGIDVQQGDFEDDRRPSYLRGKWRNPGWWYYYLYAVCIKVPLGLGVLGLVNLISNRASQHQYAVPDLRDVFILLAPAMAIFVIVSSKTGINAHLRYLLPAFPFIFIWLSGACLTTQSEWYNATQCHKRSASGLVVVVASCWIVLSSLSIYPHNLSYFNEVIGGPLSGPKHLLGSNVDWGQDRRYLKWILNNPHITCLDPIAKVNIDPLSANNSILDASQRIKFFTSQSVAISCNVVYGGAHTDHSSSAQKKTSDLLLYFQQQRPICHVAYSIRIYRLPGFACLTSERTPP